MAEKSEFYNALNINSLTQSTQYSNNIFLMQLQRRLERLI